MSDVYDAIQGLATEQNALVIAINSSDLSTVNGLLAKGVNPDFQYETMFYPIALLSGEGHILMYTMLEYHEDITPIQGVIGNILINVGDRLADQTNISILQALIAHGADITSALEYAMLHTKIGREATFILVAQELLKAGADILHIDNEGKNLLELSMVKIHHLIKAIGKRSPEVAKFLRQQYEEQAKIAVVAGGVLRFSNPAGSDTSILDELTSFLNADTSVASDCMQLGFEVVHEKYFLKPT